MEQKKEMYEIRLVSSLEKVFPEERPVYRPECMKLTCLKGETVSFQAACTSTDSERCRVTVQVESEIKDLIRVRQVENVPVCKACGKRTDDNYLKTKAGLYPDLLRELENNETYIYPQQWRSLWIDIETREDVLAGVYPVTIILTKGQEKLTEAKTTVTIYNAVLPKQKILHTEWFYADCLADYYHVPVFSEEHWKIMENYIREYVKRGGNMILTPLFTPALDTAVGHERTTTQLLDIEVKSGEYHFGFEKLKRWVDLCRSCGIQYFEMSHLFSQWGAAYAPKVVALKDGKEEKIFGWHTPASGKYTDFLHVLLPQLTGKLKEWGIAEVTWFHLSDEPREEDLDSYRAARESIEDLLDGFHTMDALSDYKFYEHGLVEQPVPANDAIQEFLNHGVENLWTYYCVSQSYEVSNRFMAMPSLRNRIYGLQLYKYRIAGILHWGYNFYNSQYSLEKLNPYQVTDAGGCFAAGDPFLVYPGADGYPEESIRMMMLEEALQDLRACELLESLAGRETVMECIEENLAEPLTFTCFPKTDYYLIALRNRINREIAKRI